MIRVFFFFFSLFLFSRGLSRSVAFPSIFFVRNDKLSDMTGFVTGFSPKKLRLVEGRPGAWGLGFLILSLVQP